MKKNDAQPKPGPQALQRIPAVLPQQWRYGEARGHPGHIYQPPLPGNREPVTKGEALGSVPVLWRVAHALWHADKCASAATTRANDQRNGTWGAISRNTGLARVTTFYVEDFLNGLSGRSVRRT